MIMKKHARTKRKIISGILIGITTAFAMLILTQGILPQVWTDTGSDPTNATDLSPNDWDLTTGLGFNSIYLQQERIDAMFSYFFSRGVISEVGNDGSLLVVTEPFYSEYSILTINPTFDYYPQFLKSDDVRSDFDLSAVVKYYSESGSSANFSNGVDVTDNQMDIIYNALANIMIDTDNGELLDDQSLQNYKTNYHIAGNDILTLGHLYSDGSILQFEMINSEVLLVEFSQTDEFVLRSPQISNIPTNEYHVTSTEYYLFNVDVLDDTEYVNALIQFILSVGV